MATPHMRLSWTSGFAAIRILVIGVGLTHVSNTGIMVIAGIVDVGMIEAPDTAFRLTATERGSKIDFTCEGQS
jgi:hypothetical protein